ncbi:hypothetical protein NMA58_13730 [Rhizobium sp. YTUHZ045]|uniref:HNH endonuclease n=1 Tax=Rhizobium sp. YTUHZ045 TaxID=2962888 RepID=UPI003DA86694
MIAEAVTYGEAEKALVDAFDSLERAAKDPGYWSDQALGALKSRVKDYYIAIQNSRCCYCDRHQGTENHRAWDVEHVADRNKYPWFMFTARNLAASCPDCNTAKGSKETLTTPGRKTYPAGSSDFRIVHPHFDDFADHIHRAGHIYLPKSKKGKNTIVMCDLLRFAEKYIEWENSATDTRFESEVNAIFADDRMMGLAAVEDVLAKLPNGPAA